MKNTFPKDMYIFLSEFRYQLRKFLNFSESAAREIGITSQQHQLLLAVMGFPERNFATPRELAERLQITHHACVGLIDRCEQLNFVSRRRNPEDGRSVLVEVTQQGREILEKLSEIHLEEINRIKFLKKFDMD
ncbi:MULTISPECIES: MarR family winged helix-turn-helix transcriptional regulator [Priestia]|jgi:DNA-binding MarR family transcriptional regulator|uniref:MarR family winged helix-turn-helix transcriptional regulator n=1 Tax=Priestia TaxID=2800373 RepID=UPI001C25076E|nr:MULTISPECIES: MarR family transcriptional regulator [Priestia]MBU8756964.1 MarR family transcriptional regulator [Priestia megaterium]MBZ6488463.1 MarR family transcriptional regulator [Priestia aryabhattai]MDH3130176.1 MarR family transcriptional regulator [Priestia aryabhattai]